jgi:ribose 5-phosphate isomerase B
MKIYVGSDHGGYALKTSLKRHLKSAGYQIEDLGTDSADSCDYPDFAQAVARKVLADPESKGLLICGTGIGISISANRFKGIRAAMCRSGLEAELARKHNNANIVALGERITGLAMAVDIVEKFFNTEFEAGRHLVRVKKIEQF